MQHEQNLVHAEVLHSFLPGHLLQIHKTCFTVLFWNVEVLGLNMP